DRAAGLHSLSDPLEAFAIYTASVGVLASTTWMLKIHQHRATINAVTPTFFSFVVLAVVIGCGPLMVFGRQLYDARHHGVSTYHQLAHEYVGAFRRKWLAESRGDEPSSVLGTSDIQSLNDLMGSYRSVDDTRLYPFGVRELVALWTGEFVPM